MSDEIEEGFVQEYKGTIAYLSQQMGSRLRGLVTTDSYRGTGGRPVEQLGPVQAQRKVGRYPDTPLIQTPHDARWVYPEDYVWADLIDSEDRLRRITDPTDAYAINGAMAMGRAMDSVIITAFFADAKTGQEGGTTTQFDTSNNQIAASSTGLTVAKMREAKKIIMAADVDLDLEPLYMAITAAEHDDLLSETQATNLDYTDRPVLVDGRIQRFMGFNLIHTELLGVDGSGNRRVPAWTPSGMHLGVWNDLDVKISERADKSYATQVYMCETIGATRLEESKVVEILCA